MSQWHGWGLRNTGQPINGVTGITGADIRGVRAWDLVRGNPRVVIVVVDTGIDLNHPDLQSNILPRNGQDWNFVEGESDPSPVDDDSHGTHVSGIAAVDNNFGVIGVAPGCRIMPLRIDVRFGMEQSRADAINFAAQQA